MIVSTKTILKKAQKGGYAVGAFNTSNLGITQSIIRAAAKLKSPVIVQTSEGGVKYSSVKTIYNIIRNVAETEGKNIPIAIHLDHGKNLPIIKQCIKVGYTSVHIDASEKPYNTNIKLTKEVVKLAKAKKIGVQAELGAILGKEGMTKLKMGQINYKDLMTDPDKAKDFVKQTGCDFLAVSVGTIHGSFKGVEKVEQARLKKIRSQVDIPLVLHGGSGLSASVFKTSIKNGICAINIDTNLRIAFLKSLKKSVNKKHDKIDPRKILSPSTDAMQAEVEKMINIFGSKNKA